MAVGCPTLRVDAINVYADVRKMFSNPRASVSQGEQQAGSHGHDGAGNRKSSNRIGKTQHNAFDVDVPS